MTILISLISDSFLSRFQNRAERFGVRGREDQRYLGMQGIHRANAPQWKYYIGRIFHLKRRAPPENDVEQAQGDRGQPPVVDERLRDYVLEEAESIQRSIDQQVDAELGIDKRNPGLLEQDIVS